MPKTLKVPKSVLRDAEESASKSARLLNDLRKDEVKAQQDLAKVSQQVKETVAELAELMGFLEDAGSTTKTLEEIRGLVK